MANICWHNASTASACCQQSLAYTCGMAFTERSADTRSAILSAARHRFAVDGYDRATIRAIAAEAGIDPSMVMRYYGSKEGLFAAAVDVDLRLPEIAELPRERIGELLVRHFVDRWDGDQTLIVLLRSAVTNESAADRLRAIFADQVAALTGDPERAVLVASQILGLALCRYVLELPPLVALDAGALAARVGPTIQRYITGPLG